MSANGETDPSTSTDRRRCFVVSAFGSSPDEQRRHKQVLRHLVQKVLAERYEVVRADQIDDEGLITNQIIEHLLEDDLVVADLTGLNPNVFYEIAVRHAARKPIVHLITKGEAIPFDVANMRAVPYALDDPDLLEEAQGELDRKVRAIEERDWTAGPNPVSAARDVWLLRDSDQPGAKEAADLLAGFNQLQDEVRSLSRRVTAREGTRGDPPAWAVEKLFEILKRSDKPLTDDELVSATGFHPSGVETVLAALRSDERVFSVPDGWSTFPF
jgi:hypothetical protein